MFAAIRRASSSLSSFAAVRFCGQLPCRRNGGWLGHAGPGHPLVRAALWPDVRRARPSLSNQNNGKHIVTYDSVESNNLAWNFIATAADYSEITGSGQLRQAPLWRRVGHRNRKTSPTTASDKIKQPSRRKTMNDILTLVFGYPLAVGGMVVVSWFLGMIFEALGLT
jgi:hypothetical protein